MQLIERFDRQMAAYPSNYGHNFLWEQIGPPRSKPNVVIRGLKLLGRKMEITLRRPKPVEGENRAIWKKFTNADMLVNRFFDDITYNGDEGGIGRLYTVEKFLERYASKIVGWN